MIVEIECDKITDWNSFHAYFIEKFGFPDFYGKNMNAFIDCMGYVDEDEEMTTLKIKKGEVLTLHLQNAEKIKKESPDIFNELIECVAFVNKRKVTDGEDGIIVLAYH